MFFLCLLRYIEVIFPLKNICLYFFKAINCFDHYPSSKKNLIHIYKPKQNPIGAGIKMSVPFSLDCFELTFF